jgi:hypothetical protein
MSLYPTIVRNSGIQTGSNVSFSCSGVDTLVVFVGANNCSGGGVTAGGVAMTEVRRDNSSNKTIVIFKLDAPSQGSITITQNESALWWIVIGLKNTKATKAIEDMTNTNNSNAASVSVSSDMNCICLDFVIVPNATLTNVSGGNTLIVKTSAAGVSYKTGDGTSISMGWSLGTNGWRESGITFQYFQIQRRLIYKLSK